MQKPGLSAMKAFDQFRSLSGSAGRTAVAQISTTAPRASSDSVSYGSFANLKLTAEKLIKEQASVKTDLEMAHTKLRKATKQIHMLEAKLQEAVNENAKLNVKQTEDAKLWKGLDSKLSSTKTLSEQLTETLQHLACQVKTAEEDKKSFEDKLLYNSKAFEDFNLQIHDLFAKLEGAGNTIRAGKKEILELTQEKEEMENSFRVELCAVENVIKQKDVLIKGLEGATEEHKKHLQTIESQLHEMQLDLSRKEEVCRCLRATQEELERKRNALQCNNRDLELKVARSCQKIKHLEDLVHSLAMKIAELDRESSTVSQHVDKLFSSFQSYYELVQQQKDWTEKCTQHKFDQLHKQFVDVTSENATFKMEAEELHNKITELQKAQEFSMVQHAEECRLAEDRVRRLESEAEVLVSQKNESEKLITELGNKVKELTEASILAENQMKDMLQKISRLESENHNLQDKMQSALQERAQEKDALQSEISKRDQNADSLENQINQLRSMLDEKEQLHISLLGREKRLEEEKSELQTSFVAVECKLAEERKQFDAVLEGKQLELSKHLKELSQRNDQAINEIRRKYEAEKVEIANAEKDKAEKLIKDIERKCDEKIAENKEEAQQFLMRVKEEHGAMISRIQQDHDQKDSTLRAYQKEELQRLQLQAENEIREKTSALRKEHEIQMKSLNMQHEDDYKKLQDELELQKSKEEKQRALLQLQWKVMGESQKDEQEGNSKKEYSVSSIKTRDPYGGKGHKLALASPESRRKDVNLSGLMRTPMANILKKVEKGNKGSAVSVPKHRKVTRHEYEVETSNGRMITKRRRTKSTVMFEDPNTQKAASKDIKKMDKISGGPHPCPANIGDLFSEGSLNPYTDDPYAFD